MSDEPIKRSVVAAALVCSAQMLDNADTGDIDSKEVRAAILTARKLQAAICLKMADIADEMVKVLQDVFMEFEGNKIIDYRGHASEALIDRVCDILRKARTP